MLEAFDRQHTVNAHDNHFEQNTPDPVWIEAIGNWTPKPVVVCGDGRILKNDAERRVLRDQDLMFVYLSKGWTNLSWPHFAWKIVKAWPGIVQEVSKVREPTIFEVSPKTEKVTRIQTVAQL